MIFFIEIDNENLIFLGTYSDVEEIYNEMEDDKLYYILIITDDYHKAFKGDKEGFKNNYLDRLEIIDTNTNIDGYVILNFCKQYDENRIKSIQTRLFFMNESINVTNSLYKTIKRNCLSYEYYDVYFLNIHTPELQKINDDGEQIKLYELNTIVEERMNR